MRKTKNWKQVSKNKKQYGKRNTERYQSDFMTLDEKYLIGEEDNEDVQN